MKILMRMVWLGCVGLAGEIGVVADRCCSSGTECARCCDTAKQIVTMEAKLADWPQLGRYRAENAALGPAESGRVVF